MSVRNFDPQIEQKMYAGCLQNQKCGKENGANLYRGF